MSISSEEMLPECLIEETSLDKLDLERYKLTYNYIAEKAKSFAKREGKAFIKDELILMALHFLNMKHIKVTEKTVSALEKYNVEGLRMYLRVHMLTPRSNKVEIKTISDAFDT